MKYLQLLLLMLMGNIVHAQLDLSDFQASSSGSTVNQNVQMVNDLAVVVVADRSSSMSGDKISELLSALNFFIKNLGQNSTLAPRVNLSVIAFDSQVQTARKSAKVGSHEAAIRLQTAGTTAMSKALEQAILELNRAKSDLKPIVVLITDGKPDDERATQQVAQRLQQKAKFVALGVTGAELSFLQQIAGSNASMLRGTNFGSFFKDASVAMHTYVMTAELQRHRGTVTFGDIPFSIPNSSGWKR